MRDKKPGLTYIDGKPYLVRLPIPSEWDYLMGQVNADNNILHYAHLVDTDSRWETLLSWTQMEGKHMQPRNLQLCCGGSLHGHDCKDLAKSVRAYHVGFRPVLIPLNPESLEPDDSVCWPGIGEGERLTMGTLYMNGRPVTMCNEQCSNGSITPYISEAKLEIGDSCSDPACQITFIKCCGKLWADRNLLSFISWDDLNAQGFCECTDTCFHTKKVSMQAISHFAKEHAYVAYKRFSCSPKSIVIFARDEQDAVEHALSHFGYPKSDWPRLSTGIGPIMVKRISPTKDAQVFET